MSNRLKKTQKSKIPAKHIALQIQAKFHNAISLQQQGLLGAAKSIYEEILKAQPTHYDAICLLAMVEAQTKNQQRAVALFEKAISLNGGNAVLYFNRGLALQELDRLDAALSSYEMAIALKPDYVGAYLNRGNILADLNRLESALASYDTAIAIDPYFPSSYNNRGLLLKKMRQLESAVADFDKAVAVDQAYAEAYFNRGLVQRELRQFDAALRDFARAIVLKPDYAEAYYIHGLILQENYQLDAALADFDKAIAIQPDYADAYVKRGYVLSRLKQHEAAIESFGRALAIKPDEDYLPGLLLHHKMRICDWHDVENQRVLLLEKIRNNEKASLPFLVLTLTDSPLLQLKAAKAFASELHKVTIHPEKIPKRTRGPKIRLGYFSMDFKNHAVSFLTAALFESHARNKFEVIAFSFGPNTQDAMRQRLEAAFDQFIDVSMKSDLEIAELARRLEIDIAIDLAGYTSGFRTDLFGLRVAPIQVGFLGYPGTMGADYIDYLIGDYQVIPAEFREFYAEKIAYLPCFQPNDRQRKISDRVFSRGELSLPANGFVYCCFNNNYKITPDVFDCWMRILEQVEGSVLWLYEDNPAAADNLRQEATQRGVSAHRLVFAKLASPAEYLARFRCADLFLDTLPYNAGTTASDALWAGLPVLTCTGEAFASRMAASLLWAIDLPELVTVSQEEYVGVAVELARCPERLDLLKLKLERNRLTTPLFDSDIFTKNIESAFTQMYERYHAGLPPEHIHV